jgi:CHAT domain-containing protein
MISLVFWLATLSLEAHARKYYGVCIDGTRAELETNICIHHIEDDNLLKKFDETFIGNEPINCDDPDPKVTTLEDVLKYLQNLQTRTARKPAILFYAYSRSRERLCSWLIFPHKEHVHSVETINMDRILSLQPDLMASLDAKKRAEYYMTKQPDLPFSCSKTQPLQNKIEMQLGEASEILLPPAFWGEIEEVDSLLVVPAYSFGEVPFSALKFNNRPLVDITSVVIVARLKALKDIDTPRRAAGRFDNPIIVGLSIYPEDDVYNLKDSTTAVEEANEIGKVFGVRPEDRFIDNKATKSKIKTEISKGKQIGLIYLSTHGVSDSENPLDGGVIWLSDGRWTGRDVKNDMSSMKGHPLVVLSACQTGLGKTFEVGTIGMDTAWYEAGASNVVMSLWRIEPQATKQLMLIFMNNTKTMPVDIALQRAMQTLKRQDDNPAQWSGFSILGLPELEWKKGAGEVWFHH